jgi:hypothetical protein
LKSIPSVFMYAMNIQNDVIGLVLRENCKSKQMTDIIAWPSRCRGRICVRTGDSQMYIFKTNDKKILSYRIFIYNWGKIFILRTLKIRYMPVFCLFTLGRHGNFTAGVTSEQPDLLCTALALNIELLSIILCAVLETSY